MYNKEMFLELRKQKAMERLEKSLISNVEDGYIILSSSRPIEMMMLELCKEEYFEIEEIKGNDTTKYYKIIYV